MSTFTVTHIYLNRTPGKATQSFRIISCFLAGIL